MRDITDTDFMGKTVVGIDLECCNVIKFSFSDGTSLDLWAECEHDGIPFFRTFDDP